MESVVIPPDVLSSVRSKESLFLSTSELEPGAGGRDVICGALALHLDQDPHVGQVSPGPLVEGGEELQPL